MLVTAYPACKTDVVNAGAHWVGDCGVTGAVVDGLFPFSEFDNLSRKFGHWTSLARSPCMDCKVLGSFRN